MLKGTQRRFAVGVVALTALSPAAFLVRPASAFPPGHSVSSFNYRFLVTTHIAKLKQTISPPLGAFSGGVDLVTGQLNGTFKVPNASFADTAAGLVSATAAIVPVKPVTGRMNLSSSQVTLTSKFLMRIVTASGGKPVPAARPNVRAPQVTLPTLPVTLPTLPVTIPTLPVTLPTLLPAPPPQPVNPVGNHCATVTPVTLTMHGLAHAASPSKFTGKFTLPKFGSCGGLTALLNKLLPGPGNTFTAVATPNPATPTQTLPTLPTIPITLPTLPVTLPTLPVTLPTLPVTLPTLPVTLPTVPVVTLPPLPSLPPPTLPTLPPATLPALPVTLPST